MEGIGTGRIVEAFGLICLPQMMITPLISLSLDVFLKFFTQISQGFFFFKLIPDFFLTLTRKFVVYFPFHYSTVRGKLDMNGPIHVKKSVLTHK